MIKHDRYDIHINFDLPLRRRVTPGRCGSEPPGFLDEQLARPFAEWLAL